MELFEKIKRYENLHVVFWLIKDSCWMMEFKILGAIMVIPTMFLAFYMVYHTFKTREFYINLAIFFWIGANSFWMMMEFFNGDHLKNYATIPFALGFIFVAVYYLRAKKKSA